MRHVLSYILPLWLVGALLCGCTDNAFTGMPEEGDGDVDSLIPIMAAVSDVDGGLSKSSGMIGNLDDLMGKTITVFAGRPRGEASYLDRNGVLLDCRTAKLSDVDFYLHWDDGKVMYYPNGERFKERYDFFAYFTDDAKLGVNTVQKDRASLSMIVDGSQDVMLAKATTSSTNTMMVEHLFSYYTARANVIPLFHFKHGMACLNFKIVPGVNQDSRYKITIQSVSMYSHSKVEMVYAAKDSTNLGVIVPDGSARELFSLKGDKGAAFPQNTYSVTTRLSNAESSGTVQLPGNLLVHPVSDPSSTLVLEIDEIRYDKLTDKPVGVPTRQNVTVVINHPQGLKAGNKYEVCMTLLGNMTVSSSVDMTPWNDAGNIEIGNENKPK